MFWIIPLVAFLASILTFFSGFGLGTLLMAAMLWYYPPELAIALTALVHLLNSAVKSMMNRHVQWRIVWLNPLLLYPSREFFVVPHWFIFNDFQHC